MPSSILDFISSSSGSSNSISMLLTFAIFEPRIASRIFCASSFLAATLATLLLLGLSSSGEGDSNRLLLWLASLHLLADVCGDRLMARTLLQRHYLPPRLFISLSSSRKRRRLGVGLMRRGLICSLLTSRRFTPGAFFGFGLGVGSGLTG